MTIPEIQIILMMTMIMKIIKNHYLLKYFSKFAEITNTQIFAKLINMSILIHIKNNLNLFEKQIKIPFHNNI